jgi:hypothetical protein
MLGGTMDCNKNKETEKRREGCIQWPLPAPRVMMRERELMMMMMIILQILYRREAKARRGDGE